MAEKKLRVIVAKSKHENIAQTKDTECRDAKCTHIIMYIVIICGRIPTRKKELQS
jgi:hypothetical protein